MAYVIYYSAIQEVGAPFSAMRSHYVSTLSEAKAFMRNRILRAWDGAENPKVQLALEAVDAITEPEGRGSLARYWTHAQGGCDGRITVLFPAPSMTLECQE